MIRTSDIVAEVRRLIQDKNFGQAQRLTDEEIRGAYKLALLEGLRMRPDFFIAYPTEGDIPDVMSDEEVDLPLFAYTPMSVLTTAYVMIESSEYNADSTAGQLLGLGRAQLGGVG